MLRKLFQKSSRRNHNRRLTARKQRHRRALLESLEARLLLTADPAGDDLASAQVLSFTPGVTFEVQEAIVDEMYADVDLFKISLTAGDVLDVDVDAEFLDDGTMYSSLDSHLRIFDSSGSELAVNANGLSTNDYPMGSYDSYLSFTAPTSGDYYIGVTSAGNESYDPTMEGMWSGNTTGDYLLQLLVTGGDTNQAPVVTPNQSFSVAEDASANASVGTVVGSDADSDTLQNWAITDGNSAGVFAIDSSSGALTISDPTNLDYETTSSYVLTVTTSDGTATSAPETVTVSVTDVDEFDVGPLNDTDPSPDGVVENRPIGTGVGLTVSANDQDGSDSVSYSLDDDAGGRFAIDADTGVVTTAAVLDHALASSHVITVRGTSTDGSIATASFTIHVLEENESIGAANDSDPAANSVAEDAAIGATVGVTIAATDPDADDTVSFSLDVDAGGRFTIDATTGIVTTSSALDAETATGHTITARAESSDGTFSTMNVNIAVIDVDEFDIGAISDVDAATDEVAAGRSIGTTVGIIALATDGDVEDTISYSLDDDAGGLFTIDADTGVIATATILALEPATHAVTARATSTDGSTTTSQFTIAVIDAGNPPVIAANQSFALWETALIGAPVGKVLATDDADILQDWAITDGNVEGAFAINPATGELTVADNSVFDADVVGSYELTIVVTDGSQTSQSEVVVVEMVAVNPPIVVNALHDNADSTDSSITLREAIELANLTSGIDTIEFDLPIDS